MNAKLLVPPVTPTPVIPLATALNLADAASESGTNLRDALALLIAAVRAEMQADAPQNECEECGAPIPGELISNAHAESCSGHPANVV